MNIKDQSTIQQFIIAIGLIVFGTIGRYVLFGMGVQPFPNFEVIMVVTFLAIMILRSPLALLIPLISMVGSDLLIGNPIFIGNQMNRIVLFTYSGFTLIALLSLFNKDRLWKTIGQFKIRTIGLTAGLGAGFVLLYDIWTNIGWWYLMYPHDASSLAAVFIAGVPFMVYHLISGVVTFTAIAVPVILFTTKKMEGIRINPFKLTAKHKIPAILLIVGLVALSFSGTAMKIPQKSEVWFEKSDQTSVRMSIVGDGWTINDNLVAYKGDTAFTLLERCAEDNGFSVDSTYYAEFDSILVNSINSAVGGTDGKYWQYYVNGQLPVIGADKYPIVNGDDLRWSFETIPT